MKQTYFFANRSRKRSASPFLLAQPVLNLPAESVGAESIDSTVHESKTVRRTDNSVAVHVQNRIFVKGYAIEGAAKLIPRVYNPVSTAASTIFIQPPA